MIAGLKIGQLNKNDICKIHLIDISEYCISINIYMKQLHIMVYVFYILMITIYMKGFAQSDNALHTGAIS